MNDTGPNIRHAPKLGTHNSDALAKAQRYQTPFLPILLLGCTVLAWTLFKTTELRAQRNALAVVYRAQSKQLQTSRKIRAALNRLAIDVKRLSGTGDPGARIIVQQLKQRGITIHLQPKSHGTQE